MLARHFVESRDLARGLKYSLLAAEQASRVFAHDDALRHYERARVCAEAQNSRDHPVLIDEAVGDIHLLRGQLQQAIGSYERAVAQATTQARRAALKLKIGETYSASADLRGLPILMAAADELDKETQPMNWRWRPRILAGITTTLDGMRKPSSGSSVRGNSRSLSADRLRRGGSMVILQAHRCFWAATSRPWNGLAVVLRWVSEATIPLPWLSGTNGSPRV